MRYKHKGVAGELTTLPGSSQIVVSHGVFVPKGSRGLGVGKKANKERQEMFAELGYDYALCTVRCDNLPQISIMVSNGWKLLDSFTSSKSDAMIRIYGKNI